MLPLSMVPVQQLCNAVATFADANPFSLAHKTLINFLPHPSAVCSTSVSIGVHTSDTVLFVGKSSSLSNASTALRPRMLLPATGASTQARAVCSQVCAVNEVRLAAHAGELASFQCAVAQLLKIPSVPSTASMQIVIMDHLKAVNVDMSDLCGHLVLPAYRRGRATLPLTSRRKT